MFFLFSFLTKFITRPLFDYSNRLANFDNYFMKVIDMIV